MSGFGTSSWDMVPVDEILSFVGGSQPPASTFKSESEEGYVRLVQIRDFYTSAHLTYVPDSNLLRKCRVNDVMIARYGVSVGRVLKGLEGAYNVALVKATPKDGIDNGFLFYLLSSDYFQLPLLAQSARSAQAGFSRESIGYINLPRPPLAEQQAIAGVLGALDDKIESNRRLTATIDGLLRAELENAILNDDNPREVRFGEIALRVGEASDPRNLRMHVPYIGLEHMPRGNMFLDEWGTSEGLGSGKSVFKEGNVLFGRLRPYFKKVGVAPIDGICSTDVLVLRPAFNESAAMLLALAASEEFIAYASAAATGTKMPRVSWDYLSDWRTVLPGEAATNRFDIDMSPLVAKAIDSVHERVKLAQLRDALLPELLSGRLRVKDAESMMENV